MHYGNGKNCELPQIIVIFLSSLSGFSHGMLFSWTSPGIPSVVSDSSLSISLEEASYFTVISPLSMLIAAYFYSLSLHKLGRKVSLLLIGIPQLLSWIVTLFAKNIYVFYVGRCLSGIGDAGVFTVVPLYISEISEPLVRGTWGNTLVIFIGTGKFAVNAIGAYSSIKITCIIGAGFALLYSATTFFLPESPYYLLAKNKEEDAKKSLNLLRWRYDTEEEMTRLKVDISRQLSETGTYMDLFTIRSNRRALIIVGGLRLAQQYCGVVAFESYTQFMFEQAGGTVSKEASSTIYTLIYIPALLFFICLADKFGKRNLSIFSSFSCTAVLSIEACYFGVQQYASLDLEKFTWVPLAGMLVYVLTSSSGLIFMPTLIQGELFTASIKEKANGVITIISGVNMLIIPKLFQSLTSNFGIFTPFAFFTVCGLLSTVFCYVYVIETKGKTLEEIQQDLKGNTKHAKKDKF